MFCAMYVVELCKRLWKGVMEGSCGVELCSGVMQGSYVVELCKGVM